VAKKMPIKPPSNKYGRKRRLEDGAGGDSERESVTVFILQAIDVGRCKVKSNWQKYLSMTFWELLAE
jgi:hypothetical protein